MKNQRKHIKYFIILVCVLCWAIMTFTDYALCKKARSPIFSIEIPVTDMNLYWGLGYRIEIKYQGVLGNLSEELKGYFYWFWE